MRGTIRWVVTAASIAAVSSVLIHCSGSSSTNATSDGGASDASVSPDGTMVVADSSAEDAGAEDAAVVRKDSGIATSPKPPLAGLVDMQDIFEFERTGISPRGKVLGKFRGLGAKPHCLERLKGYGVTLPSSIFHEMHEVKEK